MDVIGQMTKGHRAIVACVTWSIFVHIQTYPSYVSATLGKLPASEDALVFPDMVDKE